jgi:hypothetical protein
MAAQVTAYLVAVRLVDTSPSLQFILPKLESKYFEGNQSVLMNYPHSEAQVPNDYILTGGGCNVSYLGTGSPNATFVVANTLTNNQWVCKGADPPNVNNPGTATAFGIGIRISNR